ncbi:MAG: fumarylacetoacetate hydrolase family protein [Planctomycetota bacterium]|nr:fumarylacetoacetate hydrolase family protein [Planctomycetota bacterium]
MELFRDRDGVYALLASGEKLRLGQIFGIGRNYAEHAKEQGAEIPDRPMVFMKNALSACLSGDEIVVPRLCQDREQVDFEGELAIVIGRPARDVSQEQAADPASGVVLGYCVANDVSARWWQKTGSGGQFCRGKSFDTFCPLGPRITPASSVPDPGALTLRTTVNGEVMQSGTTADMIFSVATLVSDLSRGMTLAPGSVILTGTPSGVGMSRTPPRFLRAGDVVRVEIEGLGAIENRVKFE